MKCLVSTIDDRPQVTLTGNPWSLLRVSPTKDLLDIPGKKRKNPEKPIRYGACISCLHRECRPFIT